MKIVPFDLAFLELSCHWLSDPEVKALTNTPDFTREDQKKWFNNLPLEKDTLIWGIQFEDTKIGACGLRKITNTDCEYWGYIGEKTYWGKGIGTTVMQLLEQKARKMKLQSIWLKVVQDNARAIRLYQKQGYMVEEQTDNLIKMRKEL